MSGWAQNEQQEREGEQQRQSDEPENPEPEENQMNSQESLLDKSIDEIDLRQQVDDDVMNFVETNIIRVFP